jgi:hypothetical protein
VGCGNNAADAACAVSVGRYFCQQQSVSSVDTALCCSPSALDTFTMLLCTALHSLFVIWLLRLLHALQG